MRLTLEQRQEDTALDAWLLRSDPDSWPMAGGPTLAYDEAAALSDAAGHVYFLLAWRAQLLGRTTMLLTAAFRQLWPSIPLEGTATVLRQLGGAGLIRLEHTPDEGFLVTLLKEP